MAARLPVVDVERPLVKIELPHQTACGLRREAAKRETTLQRLAVELLDLVVDDGLVGAVLDVDDGAPAEPPHERRT